MTLEIIQTLDHLAESSRVLDQLRRIPRERIDHMIGILENQAAVESLLRLLRTVHELERENRLAAAGPAFAFMASEEGSNIARRSRELSKELPALLQTMFTDKERFPSVKAIYDFVKDAFRINVPYQRLNRERYIKKVIGAVRKSPKALHYARNNMMHGQSSTVHDEAYARLYNFIRGRLTE